MTSLSPEQHSQLKSYDNCFIEYPEITEIYSIFDRLRMNKSLGGEPESFLLTGETGSGKTALVNNYLTRFSTASSWSNQTVLSTRIPSRVNEQNTLTQFLVDLESKSGGRSTKRNEIALAKGVVKRLKQKSVELIIVNEVQELVEFSTAKDRQEIANTFKYISEEAGISFVLVGMPYASVLAKEPQWNSRLSWRRELNYFKLLNIKTDTRATDTQYEMNLDEKKHFARFVAGLCQRMGYHETPQLTSNDILFPLFSMCRGECRKLKHFLKDAMVTSFKEGKDTIDRETLLHTFKFKFPYRDNPFSCSSDALTVNQLKASSEYNTMAISPEDKILAPRFTDAIPLNMLLSKSALKV